MLPDPFIIKNCGKYSTEQFDRLIGMLKAAGSDFKQACEVAAD